jgi:hypothetical protein
VAPPAAAGAAAGSGSAASTAPASGSGAAASAGLAPADAATGDHPVPDRPEKSDKPDKPDKPDKSDKMPPEDRAKPAGKPVDHVEAGDRKPDKPRSRATSDDDLGLGKLQGGAKPGDKKPADARRSGEPSEEPVQKPLPKQSTDARGYLSVTSKPIAKIAIDGVETGLSTPITGRALPVTPGKHKVTFIVGADKFTFPITVKPGESITLHKDLQ